MSTPGFLDIYFGWIFGLVLCSWVLRSWKLVTFGWLRPPGPVRNFLAIGTPPAKRFLLSWKSFFADPWLRFHRRVNKIWAHGYLFYHLGVLLIVAGYGLTALILAGKILGQATIPNLADSTSFSNALSPSNLLAMVFGNAEPVQRQFLFGRFAPTFLAISWLELACAVYGQGCLMLALLVYGQGAVHGDPDPVSGNTRKTGKPSGQHLLVRTIIISIVISEILARLQIFSGIVYIHSALGLTLLVLLPHTYLFHILLTPLAVRNGMRRRKYLTIA